MKFKLITIGRTQMHFVKMGLDFYQSRIQPLGSLELIELPDLKKNKKTDEGLLKQMEGKKILSAINPGDYIILLDEKGKQFDSRQFAGLLQDKMLQSIKYLTFVVGGAYGFSPAVYKRANQELSLSKMTFPHDLVRLVFIEQLYRSLSILNNLPYHHD